MTDWEEKLRNMQREAAARRPGCVEQYGYKIFSQSDEDGIIAEIFHRIGTTNRTFVEFGAEIGQKNNTRNLLEKGWSGLWIEGNPDYAGAIQAYFAERISSGQLKFISDFVSVDNINDLIASAGIAGEIDLLSVDIDGNDYHVYKAINVIQPRVVVLEHNGYPPPMDWVMPYDPNFRWDGQTGAYGSSLVANARIASEKGYTLVGTGVYSANGFYVRDDLIGNQFPNLGAVDEFWRPLNYDAIVNFPKR
jgi:hypothetical protein